MARHLTVGTIVEKNKIASDVAFIILIEAQVKDEDGNEVAVLRFAKNSENVTFNNELYVAANFEIDISVENNSEPSITLNAQDQTRALQQYVEAYAGLVGSKVVMTVVNTGNMDGPAELEETFLVVSGSNNEYVVTLELGTESVVSKRWPQFRQFKERCSWGYKGRRCGYTGSKPSCDFTLLGENGCAAHNNVARFGGYPGINTQL